MYTYIHIHCLFYVISLHHPLPTELVHILNITALVKRPRFIAFTWPIAILYFIVYCVFYIVSPSPHTIRYFIYLPAHLNYENNHANSSHFVVNICYVVDPHDNIEAIAPRTTYNNAAKGAKGKPLDWFSLSGGQLRSGQIRSGYIYLYCIASAKWLSWICVCRLFEPRGGLCLSGWPTICLSEGCLIRPGEGNCTGCIHICVRNTQTHKSINDWKFYSLCNGIAHVAVQLLLFPRFFQVFPRFLLWLYQSIIRVNRANN